MGQVGEIIADAANVSQRYAKRLLVGIPADRFARFAAPGKQVVESNHPAFILGALVALSSKRAASFGAGYLIGAALRSIRGAVFERCEVPGRCARHYVSIDERNRRSVYAQL